MACLWLPHRMDVSVETNKMINRELTSDRREMHSKLTCAFFGLPGVGKTTLFINLLEQVGQSSRLIGSDEKQTKRQIVAFLSRQLLSLSALSEQLDFALPKEVKAILGDLESWSDVEGYPELSGFEKKLLKAVQSAQLAEIWEKVIWSTNALKKVRLQRSFSYFRDRLPEILESDYVSSIADHLYLPRISRQGYDDDFLFDYPECRVQVTVFGPMITERRKWLHMLSDISFFVFVASVTDYDDEEAWENTIWFWRDLVNNPHIQHLSIALLLNKRDELGEKLKHSPYSKTCTFDPENDLDEEKVLKHMRDRFMAEVPQGAQAYAHYTVATSLENVFVVWRAVRTSILHATVAV